ncbi:MAG: hypothetical protein RLZZ417_26 [Bacteroidota bacterium]|jgi:nicotinamidase/pyrazinamidase
MRDSALIIFGIQNDFLSVGNAEVDGLEELSKKIREMSALWDHLILINQSHPADHISFAACHPWRKPKQIIKIGHINQYLWPIHCVSGTIGYLNPSWLTDLQPFIIEHHSQKETDDFSIFENESFLTYLSGNKIKHLYFCGFPLEYEIRENTLSALNNGFENTLIKDCILSVESDKAHLIYNELKSFGAKSILYSNLIKS